MSELGRTALTYPFLTLIENAAHAVTAHVRKYWALWLALAAAAGAAAVGMYPGLARLAVRWDYPYDHSPLVLGMSAWLLVRALRANSIERIGPSFIGLAAVPVPVFLYALSEVLDVSLGMHVALPLVVLAAVAAIAGLRFVRLALIPLAMLYFTIPIWDLAILPLQRITVSAVTFALSWGGPAAYVEGNVITIPSGTFEIAEGCSGMRYFLVSLTLATFFGLFWYQRWRTRILLLGVAALASMVSNWVRIYTLILIGDATDMQHYFIAKSHDGYGWIVYVVCMAPVLWFARVLDRSELHCPRAVTAACSPSGVAPAANFLVVGLLASAVLASPALLRRDDLAAVAPRDDSLLPEGAADWRPVEAAPTWQPDFQSPYLAKHEGFVSSDEVQVDLYVARYLRQRPSSKLIAARNRLSPGWQILAADSRVVSLGGESRRVVESELSAGGERRLLWHWYIVGGRPTHDRVRAKLLEVQGLLRGRRDGAVIALSAACIAQCDDARAAMAKLVAVAGPWLEAVAEGGIDGTSVRSTSTAGERASAAGHREMRSTDAVVSDNVVAGGN